MFSVLYLEDNNDEANCAEQNWGKEVSQWLPLRIKRRVKHDSFHWVLISFVFF